jgi:succinate-acetate transporter protein
MALLCFIYLICSIRTNIAFFIIFLSLTVAFGLLTGCYWEAARGNTQLTKVLQKLAGVSCFVTCAAGWWILIAMLGEAVDFPLVIPGGSVPHLDELLFC